MRYHVSMRVDGRISVEVDATTAQDAFDKAIKRWENNDFDFNKNMEIVDSYPVNAEDENGNLTDSNY